jgi:hypothetical protein
MISAGEVGAVFFPERRREPDPKEQLNSLGAALDGVKPSLV